MNNKFEMIFTILNRGFSDLVMDSARKSGATGGTIITARGTGTREVEKMFGISVSQEKEIIMILTPKEKRNDIMTAICQSAGLNTQGKGITFSMPVEDVLGVSFGFNNSIEESERKEEQEKEETDKKEEEKSPEEETATENPDEMQKKETPESNEAPKNR